MNAARYAVGIDLGTTHCAVSYQRLDAEAGRGAQQAMLPIAQVIAAGQVEARQLLPSFLYLPAPGEFPPGALALPWAKESQAIVGELARAHGAKVPGRLVASAKSWLCNPAIDRRAALLPWGATADISKVSPLDASSRYLAHLQAAWDAQFDDALLAQQQVVVTVPASFDAGARDLTLEACTRAGLRDVTLLEEPQAALYAWLEAMGAGFRKQVSAGDVLLVVDVGGGTSDFSLIAVGEQGGELTLERRAVGDHILLGGDNMDLALAYAANAGFAAQGKVLDAWQLAALTSSCRTAKESLYDTPSLPKAALTVPGRGSGLVGGTLKGELSRDALDALLTDGFFPEVPIDAAPTLARRSGLAQVGLPYAQDAAVTRHLGAFLTRQGQSLGAGGRAFLHPTALLFNGGVFKARALQQRVVDVVNGWLKHDGGAPARVLGGADLELSVARGAAYYGWVKQGHGVRIRGGTARAYYVGVESSGLAVPGFAPPVKALCVAPFGMEEGTQADIPPQQFGLVVGQPTAFRFFASSTRRTDAVGTLLDDVARTEGLEELPEIETTLAGAASDAGRLVPVALQAAVTELGALELRCVEQGGPGAWKLELNVRMKA